MKVLFVQNIAAIAGSEKYFLAIFPELIKRGIQVEFLNVFLKQDKNIAYEYSKQLSEVGVVVHELQVANFITIKPVIKLHALVRKRGFDIVHSHLIYSDFWNSLLKLIPFNNVRSISTLHGYQENLYVEYCLSPYKLPKTLYYRLMQFCLSRLDGVYSCSHGLKEFFSNVGLDKQNKIEVIQHGFEYPSIPYRTGKYRKGEIQLCIVGRLIPRKGHLFVLNGMPEILKRFPTLKLVIAGSGPFGVELQQKVIELGIEESVSFEGFCEEPIHVMADSDVVLVPSYAEGLPLVIFEAFKSESPVIAFDTVGPGEAIENGVDGIKVNAFDEDEMIKQTMRLIENVELRQILANNAAESLTQKWTIERMTNETISFYGRVL